MRRASLCFLALLVALAGPMASGPAAAAGAVPVVVVQGKGWGHGVGMAQDGAYWEALAGQSAYQILGGFYPGVGLGRGSGQVRVVVLDTAGGNTTLGFPSGGQVLDSPVGRQSPGFPVNVPPGGEVQVTSDGTRWTVQAVNFTLPVVALASFVAPAGTANSLPVTVPTTAPPATTTTTPAPPPTTTTTAPPPTTAPPTTAPRPGRGSPTTTAPKAAPKPPGSPTPGQSGPAGSSGSSPAGSSQPTTTRPLWAVPAGSSVVTVPATGRSYRGLVQTSWGTGGVQLINQLDVETYLKGMGEVLDGSWPVAALEAQAIAARTYALRAMAISGQICDDQRCQVYLGAQVEYPAMNDAVDATAHQVLVYGGQLASALYSANGGGFSADPVEAFGPTGVSYPYLRPAPYRTQNPMPWTATIALSDVAARLGYPGQVAGVTVSRTGPSGRAEELTLTGTAGTRTVAGYDFSAALALRSTLFTTAVGRAASAPPPPPSQSLLQAPPGAVVIAGSSVTPPPLPARSLAGGGVPLLLGLASVALFLGVASTAGRKAAAIPILDRVRGFRPRVPDRLRIKLRLKR